ncbi:MAG: hypothetical protein O3A46_01825 [Candidatus Poribacteria bacterium]|nr:hypothetical protein [Candidatus Poribacteria bacterium]
MFSALNKHRAFDSQISSARGGGLRWGWKTPTANRHAPFYSWNGKAFVLLAALGLLFGCEGKKIQNLGDIEATVELHLTGIFMEIFLMTEDGDRLYWDTDISSPVGAGILPIEDLDTKVDVWSMKNGQRHEKVYSGRLFDFHWNVARINSFRSLLGEIPASRIKRDLEADGPQGEIDLIFVTPNQGNFTTTLFNAPIYPVTYFR